MESSDINSVLPIPRSLEFGIDTKNKIFLGTLVSEIFEIEFKKNLLEGPMIFKPLFYYHYSLSNTDNNKITGIEYWSKKNLFISVSEDSTLRLWNTDENKQISYIKLDVDNKGNKLKSNNGNMNKATALNIHADENDIAVGFLDGTVRVKI